MAVSESRPVVIRNDEGGSVPGTLQVRKFDTRDRVLRAAVGLVLMWVLALASVPILVAHFVLVPGFLIGGLVVAYLRYRTTEVNESVTGTCPTCGNDMTITLDSSDRLPLWTYCVPSGHPIQLLDSPDAGRRPHGEA